MVTPIGVGATAAQQTPNPAGQDQNNQLRNTEQTSREIQPDQIQERSAPSAQSQSTNTDQDERSQSLSAVDAAAIEPGGGDTPRGSIVDVSL
jgi:hypothetical protein